MRDYADLVERLRHMSECEFDDNPWETAKDAADAIEELIRENDALGRSLCEGDDLLKKLERENRRNTKEEHHEH